MILAGDIGGTNARLAYFQPKNGDLHLLFEKVYPSREFADFGDIVVEFLKELATQPEIACFGIAGPVQNGRVATSNLPWIIEQQPLAERTHLSAVLLINDLEANAWGIGGLAPEDLTPLNRVPSAAGNQAVIAPGTGLGEAGLFWNGVRHEIFASEGGHADFAPQGELQIELLRFLSSRFGHVSYERILSGPGLVNVYEFLGKRNGTQTEQSKTKLMAVDAPAAISRAALNGTDTLAGSALDLWISVYGSEAGNLALKTMATGGVFLGGGISPKILPKLTGSTFMNAFLDKGRLKPLLESIPVQVITNDKAGLLGAARCAAAKLNPVFMEAS
jgi:glucokinase